MALIKALTSPLTLCLLTLVLHLIPHSTAHFLLHYPATVGFDDDLEGQAPCGSFTVDFSKDNVTDFHVGGDSIALTSTHPMATWLFRATLDQTGTKGNWTNLLPPVSQSGLGNFCERSITVPESWAGQKGVISVVQDAADGLLYQCAAVSFVAGPAPSSPPSNVCSNATGLTAAYTADAQLSSIPATATAMPSDSSSPSATATGTMSMSGTPSGTATAKSDAQMLTPLGGSGLTGWGMGIGLVVMIGLSGLLALG